ncbi:MAG: hypothetical protein ACJA0C_000992 [Candidatus Endobugula sp.]
MTKNFLKSTFASVVVVFSANVSYASADNAALQDQYEASIADAGVIQPDEVKTVATLTAPNGKFVTWTSYPDSYKPGSDLTLAWGETWVTQNGAVLNQCKAFVKDEVNLRIQQLLGLPPQEVTQRYFAVLDVKVADMFRPCANPSLAATECTTNFPDDVSESHKVWYAGQTAAAYQSVKGYPWTRLGYTYDWNPQTDEEGVSEFVIKKGATVNIVSLTPTEEYCQ